MMKTLIHVHTDYSFDSNISVEALAAFAKSEGFGCLAVTDHDTIEGARRLAAITDAKVIVGEEVTTREGHLIGLFLEQRVPPGMSARDTALAIREQGGLVLVPHPFVALFECGLQQVTWEIADLIDAVEINNAQNLLPGPDRKAKRFASELGLATFVGSDSHINTSIAPCYQLMRDFSSASDFLGALRLAKLVPGRHPLSYFIGAAQRTIRHRVGLGLPDGFGTTRSPRIEPAMP